MMSKLLKKKRENCTVIFGNQCFVGSLNYLVGESFF